jgi:HSP20 family protein
MADKVEETNLEATDTDAEVDDINIQEAKADRRGWVPMAQIEAEIERGFEKFMNRGWLQSFPHFPTLPSLKDLPSFKDAFEGKTPRVNVISREEEIVVEAELPGVQKGDIDISLGKDSVTIKAQTRSEKEEEEGEYHRREISRGYFSRTVALASAVDGSAAKATFIDGLLTLRLPRVERGGRQQISIE